MWIGVLWAGLRVAMWITNLGGGEISPWPARKVTDLQRYTACERVRPLQGSKSRKSGKEGFGVKKLPFPSPVLLFLGFYQGKPQNCQGFSFPAEPIKSLEKTEKTLK